MIVKNSSGVETTRTIAQNSCPNDVTYGQVYGKCYGNYAVQVNSYGSPPSNTSFSMWAQSASCWGIDMSVPVNSTNSYWNAPLTTRGWSYGYNARLNGTTGLQVSSLNSTYAGATTPCPTSGTASSVCVKWEMSVPGVASQTAVNTASNTYTNWNALLDIYFHSSATPSNTTNATFDLQIYQMVMDWQASNSQPNWAYNIVNNNSARYSIKTIGGVTYLVTVNLQNPGTEGSNWVGSGGSLNAVSMFVLPTYYTSAAGSRSYLWGSASVTHDVGGIIAWLSQTETRSGVTGIFDDSGTRLWDRVRNVAVSTPVLDPSYYLTGLNPGFEVVTTNTSSGTYPNNTAFTTTNLWMVLPGEAVGN